MYWLIYSKTPNMTIASVFKQLVNHPGPTPADVARWVKTQNVLTQGVNYGIIGPLPQNDPNPQIVVTERYLSNLSPQAVAAALSVPHGQPGMNRPDDSPDNMGFQKLGDQSLPVSADENVFGEIDDGTFTDMITNGGRMVEQRRHDLPPDLNANFGQPGH